MRSRGMVLAGIGVALGWGCRPGTPAVDVGLPIPTAAQAMDESSCPVREDRLSPLVVDWTSSQRGELEANMTRGLAVVAYDCHTIRFLPDCHLEGAYGYVGFTKKEDVIRLESRDELRANLPKIGGALGIQIGGELERGASVEIATVMVGRRRTTRFQATARDLKGSCEGATHFLRGAHVGAFVLDGGSQAKARSAAELFGGKVEGGAMSRRVRRTVDGVANDCPAARADDSAPPGQCSALIRVELAAITTVVATTKAEDGAGGTEPSCPKDMVLTQGKCARPGVALHECKKGDLRDCTDQCARGHAGSCTALGRIYSFGDGVPKDEKRALGPFTQGCNGGDVRACSNLGVMYADGIVVPKDDARALALYTRACDAGHPMGCSNLGTLYVNGAGVPKDGARALALYKRACDGGETLGCANLGGLYGSGIGVPKDEARAFALSKQACDGGQASACSNLGILYQDGTGVPKDEARAVVLYKQSCEAGDAGGCSNLAWMYRVGVGVPKDEARAAVLFTQGCDAGNATACANLGGMFQDGAGVAKDEARAVALYKRACDRGSATTCSHLGALYRDGTGVPKDPARAAALFKQACDGEDPAGCSSLRALTGK